MESWNFSALKRVFRVEKEEWGPVLLATAAEIERMPPTTSRRSSIRAASSSRAAVSSAMRSCRSAAGCRPLERDHEEMPLEVRCDERGFGANEMQDLDDMVVA